MNKEFKQKMTGVTEVTSMMVNFSLRIYLDLASLHIELFCHLYTLIPQWFKSGRVAGP